ncbi:hypothetical protein [Halanaerobacter jeridensis]|uniref:Uncharacterized protein n=1 Tax=Halanaerobacter jeridensis TaxID=706427 RepID=A0A938XS35_9FIRM|nr:hypothetical protein [Halanaerobacter jeridensis]MBM7556428.1 hypothetical protein [Halanaerobacter jeridensis]
MAEKDLEAVAEISGAIYFQSAEILIGDDSNQLYIYQKQELQQNIKIPGGLQDPEAICMMGQDKNKGKIAIYGDSIITIIQLSIDQQKFNLKPNCSQKHEVPFREKKKVESLEYNPYKKSFVLIDRRKKDNFNLGSGIIYEYNSANNKLINTRARIGKEENKNDCKPTDMVRKKERYYVLTEEKIFTLNLDYQELEQQKIAKIKDAEAIYLKDNHYVIFIDQAQAERKAKLIPKS